MGDPGGECPTCGRADFETVRGMKWHHSYEHGESLAGVVVECAWCGGSKRVRPCKAEDHDRHFCGAECKSAYRAENWVGEDAPAWAGGRIQVVCAWCGGSKRVKPHEARERDRHFCHDRGCKSKYRAENWVGEDAPAWNGGRVRVNCAWCGESKMVSPHRKERSENHFCNRTCKSAWRAVHYTGENNPLWKDETAGPDYGPGWNEEKREGVRERDGRECQVCGRTEEEQFEDHEARLTVHHIVPRSKFDDPLKANAEANLIAVCVFCHPKAEKMTPLVPPAAD